MIELESTPYLLPWGLRGQRPVRFHVGTSHAYEAIECGIPGVQADPYTGIVACGWDMAPLLAQYWGLEARLAALPHPSQRFPDGFPWPLEGDTWFRAHATPRPHQWGDLDFLAPRAYGYLANDPRTGKTPVFLWLARRLELSGLLCIVPPRTRPGWARETARWLQERALVLEGRGGNEARLTCLRCQGSGWLGRKDHGAIRRDECPDCEGSRSQLIRIRDSGKLAPLTIGRWDGDDEAPPPDDAFIDPSDPEFMAAQTLLPPLQYGCRDHKYPRQARGAYCRACAKFFYDTYHTTRVVIAHKQIFIGHKEQSGEGRELTRTDLPGWGAKNGPIWTRRWAAAVVSEAHEFRGYDLKSMNGARTHTFDRVYDAIADIPRVYCESGTPIWGTIASGWAPMHLMSLGLLGDRPKDYDVRYAGAKWVELDVGLPATARSPDEDDANSRIITKWDNSGETDLAKTELGERTKTWTRRVTRREANPDKPEIVWDPIFIDSAEAERTAKNIKLTNHKGVFRETRRLSQYKWPTVLEFVVADLMAGYKTYALFNYRVEARKFQALVDSAMAERDTRVRARMLGYYSTLITGDIVQSSATKLDELCERFCTHPGIAFCAATYDQTAGGISLADRSGEDRGPHSVEAVDWPHSPFGMLQSVTRADEAWNNRLTVRVYSLSKTLDAPVSNVMLPALEASSFIIPDKGHTNIADTMRKIEAHHNAAPVVPGYAASVAPDGRLMLAVPGVAVAAPAPAPSIAIPTEVPAGLKVDVFARILKDLAGIDASDDRSYRFDQTDDDEDDD